MKKWIALVLAVVLVLSLTACDLFANKAAVKLGDGYTHNDPKGLSYDTRTVLRRESFGEMLESYINIGAYPDTMVYDEEGNMIGIYDYDPETGLAVGWRDLADGSYTAFEAGEEVDLGKPDPDAMVSIPGTVDLYVVLYGKNDAPVAQYTYLCLTDETAKDVLVEYMPSFFGMEMTEAETGVLVCAWDQDAVAAEMDGAEGQGALAARDIAGYTDYVKQAFSAREYGAVNPYKPYAGHTDPEGLDFDQKVILTGSGEAAVPEEYISDISSMTDYIYGKDGQVVAQYTYYECPSKEAADKLMEPGVLFNNAQRVTDTVILCAQEGQTMEDLLSAYIGYNVLKDTSVDAYVQMLEETNFTSVYEG